MQGVTFVHDPLPHPAKQLRLLSFEIHPAQGSISCRLGAYSIGDAPPYFAISYCCGDPAATEAILVNGKRKTVNRNCLLVLQQAKAQQRGGLYWIDSLCINQSDLEEKAVQVHRIAAIFSGASEVWACFGSDDNDSQFLLECLARFPLGRSPSAPVRRSEAPSNEMQSRTVNWLVSLGKDFDRFANALKAFSRRPFFSRTWIYQEMFLASGVFIICGARRANLYALKDITEICSTLTMRYRPFQDYDYKEAQEALLTKLSQADLFMPLKTDDDLRALDRLVNQLYKAGETSKEVPFAGNPGIIQTLAHVQPLDCEDPRDKVFAIISMFGKSCVIVPNYTEPAFHLALRVLDEYGARESNGQPVELADRLCRNLQLTKGTMHLISALTDKRHSDCALNAGGTLISLETAEEQIKARQRTPWACRVLLDESGQPTAPFQSRPTSEPLLEVDKRFITVGNHPVAVGSVEFRPDDWIAPLGYHTSDYYNNYCLGLVFRPHTAETYNVVGEVAFYPGCSPCDSWETCKCQFGPDFHEDFATTFDISFRSDELLLVSLKFRSIFDEMRKESQTSQRCAPVMPPESSPEWEYSSAVRRDITEPLTSPPKVRQKRKL